MKYYGTKDLFRPTDDPASFWHIVAWWELRRIAFNVLIGMVGIVSLIVFLWILSYVEAPDADGDFSPLLSVAGFGLVANLLYTGGWIVEGLYLAIRKRGSTKIGPRLFKAGLTFSFTLTCLPAIVVIIRFMAKTLHKS